MESPLCHGGIDDVDAWNGQDDSNLPQNIPFLYGRTNLIDRKASFCKEKNIETGRLKEKSRKQISPSFCKTNYQQTRMIILFSWIVGFLTV